MKKKCKIVMLSTNITSNTEVLHIESGGRIIRFNSSISPTSNYHLYIISDDEIKEGDWCISFYYNTSEDEEIIIVKQETNEKHWSTVSRCKKIIATTDKLIVGWDYRNDVPNGNDYNEFIPGIPEELIRLYIEKYNSGHPIEEVEVEYNDEPTTDGDWEGYSELKLDANNCISIQSTKDSYTREEVEVLMRKTWRIACSDTDKALLPELEDKFIEENL